MHYRQLAADAHLTHLLDHYAAIAAAQPAAMAATALRTGSIGARQILARVAGAADLATLLAAAHGNSGIRIASAGMRAVAELGRVIGLQNVQPQDRADGLALLDLALAHTGPEHLSPAQQVVHAQLAFTLGHYDRTAQLCRSYSKIPERSRYALQVDLANPVLGQPGANSGTWLAKLRRFLPEPALQLIDQPGLAPLDQLVAAVGARAVGSELISVIVTSYRPDRGLITAVRSVLCQTWQAVEVLVVDDASPLEYDPLLRECEALDSRVRLVIRQSNGGTYLARNTGLAAARGEFVTFQDSDDWSHPARLETQIQPLLADEQLVGSLVEALNVTDQLLVTRPGRDLTVPIPTQLMFRLDRVVAAIGYFDQVRKAADTEFLCRIKAVFGAQSVLRIGEVAYALHRVRTGSLSDSDFAAGWVHPARAAYWAAYRHWHRQIRAGLRRPYRPPKAHRRPYAVPGYIRGDHPAADPPVFDVIFAGDWRGSGPTTRAVVDEARSLVDNGLRVGVMQLESLHRMAPQRDPVNESMQALINDAVIDQVLLCDEALTALLIVRSPEVLQFCPATPSSVRASRTLLVADQPPVGSHGSGWRYLPEVCTTVAERMFSAPVCWSAHDPAWRTELRHSVDLLVSDYPTIIDPASWRLRRGGFRSTHPVVGAYASEDAADWPADRHTLSLIYPESSEFDVRLWGSMKVPLSMRGTWHLPANWLAYRPADISARSFLHQLDFYVYFPRAWRPAGLRPLLEALAAGCVVLAPPSMSHILGQAAVYCAPYQVQEVIGRLYADPEAQLSLRRRVASHVEELANQRELLELVSALSAAPAALPLPGNQHTTVVAEGVR